MTNRKLDLVLVNPGNRRQVFQSLAADLAAVEPPVWAGLIATFIRARGFAVQIVDAEGEGLSFMKQQIELSIWIPPSRRSSFTATNLPHPHKTCRRRGSCVRYSGRKRPDLKTILVGGHVAALPERTLLEENVDFTCDGEGPHTILQLLQALMNKETDLRKVGGLVYRSGGTIVRSGPAPSGQRLGCRNAGHRLGPFTDAEL